MATLLWMECGSCNGESVAILGTGGISPDNPTLPDFHERNNVRLLDHPSFSAEPSHVLANTIARTLAGEQELTLLCVEGSIINGRTIPGHGRQPPKYRAADGLHADAGQNAVY